jgi:DeoR family glycerol-3-phosphate regulon repressor
MAGGELRGDNGAAFGASAVSFVERFKVRHAIISIGAIDADGGLMDYNLAEAEFARMVLTRGQRATVVTDRSKFGRAGLVKVCDFADIDVLVTDSLPDSDLVAKLHESGVDIEVARPETARD